MSNTTLDELLEKIDQLEKGGVEAAPSVEEKQTARSVMEFIQTFEIMQGDTRVPNYKIFYDYISWDRFQSTKLSKTEFFRQFGKYFDSGRGNKGRYYLLDENSFDLSEESLTKAKNYDNIYQKRGKKSRSKV